MQLNQELVLDTLARLDVPRLTLDVDGTTVHTGATVAWAFLGFNPHHRNRVATTQPVGILKEAEAGAKSADLSRRHGISEQTFYRWKARPC